MANIIMERTVSLDGAGRPEFLQGTLYALEDQAHTFKIKALRGGEVEALTGTVSGSFIRPDQNTVALTGSIEDGCAVVTLSDDCYAIAGRFTLSVFVTAEGTTMVVYCLTGNIKQTETGSVVDPGTIVPSVAALINQIEEATESVPASATQLRAAIAETYSPSSPYAVGAYAWYDGVLYCCTTTIATGESWTAAHWALAPVGDGVTELKTQILRRPDILDEVETDSDLDIVDDDGNVLMRLAGGHVQTKHFDSALSPGTMDAENEGPDLDVTDPYGDVLMRFEDGGVETKEFRGFRHRTYASETGMYYGTALTLTCPKTFRKGDRVVIHCERGAMPWDYGAYVTYYEGQTAIKSNWRGDCAWLEYTIMEDGAQISAAYAANATGMTNGQVRLEVSLLGDIPITPTVVTVKQDGGGDYTTLRGALDAIGTKANDVLNPYRIEIYPGTYDVMADYTDAEIGAAAYDQTSFVGPKLLNGMYLIGIGLPGEIVLTASLDPNEWSNDIRGVISTLNCQGSSGFENLTIIAHNLRYCVHDDFHTPIGKKPKRIVKNCVFRGYDVTYTPCTTYGAGTSDSGCDYEFINCDFGDNAGVHTVNGVKHPSYVHLVNCVGHGFRIGDNDQTNPVPFLSEYRFDNCDFLWINQRQPGAAPHVTVTGSGGSSPLYQFTPETLYTTGDVVIIPNVDIQFQGGVGSVVRWYSNSEHGPRWALANGADDARGIVVWQDADNTYVQTKGYVRTDRTGITNFSKGDYVGVANGAAAIASGADNAFGRIDYIDNTGAGYIKLNWR